MALKQRLSVATSIATKYNKVKSMRKGHVLCALGEREMIRELEVAKTPTAAVRLAAKGYHYISGGTETNRLNSDTRGEKGVLIQKLPFRRIEKTPGSPDGEMHQSLRIGSLCTFSQCLASQDVPDDLKVALRHCFSLQKRNMATIGGNVAAARDDSYLIPTLAALNSKVVVFGKRQPIPVMEYLRGRKTDNLIEAVIIPLCKRRAFSYRIANTFSSHSIITLSIGCCQHDGRIKHPIAVAAIKGVGVIELADVDGEIDSSGALDPERIQAMALKTRVRFRDDLIYGSAEFRRYELGAVARLTAEGLKAILAG